MLEPMMPFMIFAFCRKGNENRDTDNTEQNPKAVHDAIDQFLFQTHLWSKSLHKERIWYRYCKIIARRILRYL